MHIEWLYEMIKIYYKLLHDHFTLRFEALAATGNHSAEEALKWLARHVNDPRYALPDCELPICCNDVPIQDTSREYCLILVPAGTFREQIKLYFDRTARCGFNEAHNFMPHMKLTPFFKVDHKET